MKTSEQVEKWINNHNWAALYYYNALKERYFDTTRCTNVISHDLMGSTISSAFTWRVTPEGHAFWQDIDEKFRAWFYKPEEVVVDASTDSEILYQLLKVAAIQHDITKIVAERDDKVYIFKP